MIAEIEATRRQPRLRRRKKRGRQGCSSSPCRTCRRWWMISAILREYSPSRVVLGLVLMAAQAFFYNAIFFSYAVALREAVL